VAEPTSLGRATVLACPQCAEPLYEVEEGPRFHCVNGHGYRPEELCPGIANDLEGLLPALVDALIA
jgi:hypothetical protein